MMLIELSRELPSPYKGISHPTRTVTRDICTISGCDACAETRHISTAGQQTTIPLAAPSRRADESGTDTAKLGNPRILKLF